MIRKVVNYIKESKEEIKKVIWPSKKEAMTYTLLVISVSLVLAGFLGLLDFILTKIFQLIIA